MFEKADVVVVGGGFYGARVALALAALRIGRIVLLEREGGLMRRASFVNQARLHNGYHYPRAPRTGASARRNFGRFLDEYRFAVRQDVQMVYAIARQSLVSPDQFVRFCAEIGAVCEPVGSDQAKLFDSTSVEAAFAVEEFSFDAALIAVEMSARLRSARVECRFGTAVRIAALSPRAVTLQAGPDTIEARHVLNCTYASLDGIGVRLGVEIKKELAEIAMIRPPQVLSGLAVTVMDGPFFSAMPFPPLSCHSLTHVRYTPHCAWTVPGEEPLPGRSRAELMLRDAARFLPVIEASEPLRSFFEIKAVLLATELNDARPILLEPSPECPRIISILGSKLDHVYDVEALLTQRDWD